MRYITLMPRSKDDFSAHMERYRPTSIGGKGAQLAAMNSLGLPVPFWFAVNQTAWADFSRSEAVQKILAKAEPTAAFAESVQDLFLSLPFPESLQDELRELLGSAHTAQNSKISWLNQLTPLAVRSSGVDEDSVQHSFAGQFSSFLFQRGYEQVEKSIKLCWASAFSERGLIYRQRHGLPLVGQGVAVIVQKMVDAYAAGVGFSQHPLRVLEKQGQLALISGVYGAGEGLVSGLLDADNFTVDTKTYEITPQIVRKKEKLALDSQGHLVPTEVPDEMALKPVLDDHEISQITKILKDLEAERGIAQDIEWVVENSESGNRKIWIVQTRPITTIPPKKYFDPSVNGQEPSLWDNSNIIESYSGVTTPLTFSFASRAYYEVYYQFCHVMGVPQDLIVKNAGTFRNLLGLLRGRIYYNLPNWYALVLLLPGSSTNKSFMETMMGVKQQLKPELESLFAFAAQPPKYSMIQKVSLLAKTMFRFFSIDSIVNDFFHGFQKIYSEAQEKIRNKSYDQMSFTQLTQEYVYLETNLLRRWKAPIINDYLCMIFFGVIKKLTGKWLPEGKPTLQNDLLCGEGGLDSTEPTKKLMNIAKLIDSKHTDFSQEFVKRTPSELKTLFQLEQLPQEIQREINIFLDLYGFRCINELKLEELDLHDDPEFVFTSIQSYLKTKSYNVEELSKKEQTIRAQAEMIVAKHLTPIKRLIFQFVLKNTRKAVKNRENLRFARTKVFGISRHLFRAMGRKLFSLGLLENPNDIFYLTLDEIIQFVEGRSVTQDIKALSQQRIKEFQNYRETPSLPDRLLTYGAVGVSLPYVQVFMESDLLRQDQDLQSHDPNVLVGTPCSPGVIEGTVRVVHTLKDASGLHGEILVTARTDPGWVPLFPACSALLIERGSLLSHSAVVARELGIPTIVGISGGLMERLKTGDRVRVDGGSGKVEILERLAVAKE